MKRVLLSGLCLGCALALTGCVEGDAGQAPASRRHQSEFGSPDASTPDEMRNPTAGRIGALPDGGAASCVESYSPAAVSTRAFAFDGAVIDIGPSTTDAGDDTDLGLPGVTFEVGTWFAGGTGDTVTVDMQSLGVSSGDLGSADAYGLGSRLLVSGEPRWGGSPLDRAIAWGCGFSRYYDRVTAKSWRRATHRGSTQLAPAPGDTSPHS
jgi:hypothetical protein